MGTYCSRIFDRFESQAKPGNLATTATSSSQTATSMGQTQVGPTNGLSHSSPTSDTSYISGSFKDKYVFEKAAELGRGNFATVLLGKNLLTGEKVAVKRIRDSELKLEDRAALVEEIKVLQTLDHPNIIKFFDYFPEKPFHLIVTEYVAGGELFDRITEKEFYTEEDAVKIVRTIAKAIEYLHSKNVVHRDLKPENCLVATDSKGNIVDENIKLADFGFAKIGSESLSTACGTPGYVAPEILKGEKYGKEVDLWSFGVIIYILLCGYPPFIEDEESGQKGLFDKIKQGNFSFTPEQYWRDVGDSARDLINKLLVVDPKKRMTVTQLLSHPWLNLLELDQTITSTLTATTITKTMTTTTTTNIGKKELKSAKENIKQFQAKQKWHKATNAIKAMNKFKNMAKSAKQLDGTSDEDEPEQQQQQQEQGKQVIKH